MRGLTVAEVLALLEAHRDERGIARWARAGGGRPALGIGLTTLRRLARDIGRDHELARALWTEELYEARVLSLLLDDPRRISRAQAEAQVGELADGQLAHVFASCDAPLARAPFARALAADWMRHEDPVRRRCGYGLLYELSKAKGKAAGDDDDFSSWIAHIEQSFPEADPELRLAMATALMGIAKRSARLNREALRVARAMGPVDWDPTGACEPFDVVKHIDNPRLRAALGIAET